MSIRRIFLFSLVTILFLIGTGLPTKSFPPGNNNHDEELIAGRNVNMVSGTTLPLGDPFLQRQNEPSIAVSSRNPLHLFAAANDYRTIDVPDDYSLPGIEGASTSYRDAWIGVFESFDGGESWITGLLPGFPQDGSSEALASPIHTMDNTACDPRVVAGAEGLFYLCGITFNRGQQGGGVFVSRYVDFNDRETVVEELDEVGHRKFKGPIRYVDTKLIDRNTKRRFIDMPNIAVDVPRCGKRYGTVYVAYTVFLGTNPNITRSRILLKRSTNGGSTWSRPTVLSEFQGLVQRPVIVIDPGDPTGRTVYVVFRRFAFRRKPDAILFVKSRNGGRTFSHPRKIATLHCPFDQWTKGDGEITSHRTNSYPTMAVEVVNGKGIPYVVWAQRYDQNGNLDPDGQARIVFSYSRNRGFTWSEPQLVDPYYVGEGHQFMPSITCAGGNKTVIWYDQRDDIALHDPYVPHEPYEKFMEDVWLSHRHTIDVRAAEAPVGSHIFEPSILLSRYLYFMQLDEFGEPYMDGGEPLLWQGEFNFTGLPLFHLGTKPFQGDYIQAVSSPNILPPPSPGSNSWAFNTDPSEPTRVHGVWSDTRDVWPPGGNLWGDWITYNPPNSDQNSDYAHPYPCANIDTTGMRNQNIYTADLNHGVVVGSPVNTKQLDIKRSFVVFVKDTIGYNDTNGVQDRTFHLSLQEVGGVNASFDQLVDDDSLIITVPPHSAVSSTVYVDPSSNLFAPVIVNVEENGTLVGRVYLNPDSTNKPIPDLGDELHTPRMSNPRTWRYDVGNQDEPNSIFLSPRAQNPRAQNSGYVNPRAQNPRAQNPRAQNPRAQNPRAQNENIVNNSMYNPRAQNPRAQNTALSDMTWTVTNDGNTTSAYSFNIASDSWQEINAEFEAPVYEESLVAQVLVYRTHMAPIDNECELFLTHADQLLVNVTNPRAQNPRAQNTPLTSSNITALGGSAPAQSNSIEPITFYLAPGEQAEVIFRVYDPDIEKGNSFDDYINYIGGQTEADAANTGETEPELVEQPDAPWGDYPSYLPEIGTDPTSLSFTAVLEANPDDQILTIWNSGGGDLTYTIADDADWLSVWPLEGISHEPDDGYTDDQPHTVSVNVSGLPLGTYQGTITITDPDATNNPLRVPVTLTISGARYLKVTGNSTVMAGNPKELTITAYDEYDYVATEYAGPKQLIFSGPGPAPDGTPPTVEGTEIGYATTVNFTNGVSDPVVTLIAYLVETSSLDVTDGTIDSFEDETYDYDLIVTAAPLSYIKIQHVGGGPEVEIGNWNMAAGENLNCCAVGYDGWGNYREDVHVTWSTTGDLDPITSGPSECVIFMPASAPTSGTIFADHAWATDDATGTITVEAPLEITTTSIPDGVAGDPYTAQIDAQGGIPPYQYSWVPEGTEWLGLTMNTSTGAITGTPNWPQSGSKLVRVIDSTGTFVTKAIGFYFAAPQIVVPIPNFSFEFEGSPGMPLGWENADPGNGATYIWGDTANGNPAHSGDHSVGIGCPTGACPTGSFVNTWQTIDLIPVDNSKSYRLTIRAYWEGTPDPFGDQVVVWIKMYDENGDPTLGASGQGASNTIVGEWQEQTSGMTPAHFEHASFIRVVIERKGPNNSDAVIWIDNLELTGSYKALDFEEPPSNVISNQPFSPEVQVKAIDYMNQPVEGLDINLELGTNPYGAALDGSTQEPTLADGIATFTDLKVDIGGWDYTLVASAQNYYDYTSLKFDVEGFAAINDMLTKRKYHTATKLDNGYVLIAGGYNETSGYLGSAELYNPYSNSFSDLGVMGRERSDHTATLLPGGDKVLLIGGAGSADNTAEIYYNGQGFSNIGDTMHESRRFHSATLLDDGKVLIIGGADGSRGDIFDPSTNLFTETGGQVVYPKRYVHTATKLRNGKVLIVGGVDRPWGEGTVYLSTAEIYDPSDGTFTSTGNMTTPRANHTATLLLDGKVLIAGGGSTGGLLNTAEIFDPLTGFFTSVTDTMAISRARHSAIPIVDGSKVLIIGGLFVGAEIYDYVTQEFQTTGPLPTGYQLQDNAAVLLSDEVRVLVTGGTDNLAKATNIALIWYPKRVIE